MIEIGLRSDFPITSYSDTYKYIIFLVQVAESSGKTARYYYGPLQRVRQWRELVEAIRSNPELSGKLKIGKLKRTGREIPDFLASMVKRTSKSVSNK